MRQNDLLFNKRHGRGWLTSALMAAVLVCGLVSCQADVDTGQTDTEQIKQESFQTTAQTENTESLTETDAPDSELAAIETLAEGQERDWKIEDVLKNDLEIDGIPISIPCTVDELLTALGSDYSLDTSFLDNEQEKYSLDILFKNKKTMLSIVAETVNDGNDDYVNYTVQAINCFEMNSTDVQSINSINLEKGAIGFRNIPDNCWGVVSKYELPDEFISENNRIKLKYNNEYCYMSCTFEDNILKNLVIGYKGESENE